MMHSGMHRRKCGGFVFQRPPLLRLPCFVIVLDLLDYDYEHELENQRANYPATVRPPLNPTTKFLEIAILRCTHEA
jgi:hypothetical protein